MKLSFESDKRRYQADPFIFENGGKFYLYVTARDGVEAYSADTPFSTWHFEGIVCKVDGGRSYWAPCIIEENGWFYMYYSCDTEGFPQSMHVSRATSPLGPFVDAKRLYDRFTIDSHVVKTAAGLFLWYAEDNMKPERKGTRIFVDKLLDPYTPAHRPVEKIVPTMDEENCPRNRYDMREGFYTLEGPFWLEVDGWQYLMYSGGCYSTNNYHIGYASAKTAEQDLTKVEYDKHTNHGAFDPLLIENEFEEGTGHHSVLHYNGAYYAIYHGRDLDAGAGEQRTARVCKLFFNNGVVTAERYPDQL